MQIIQNKNKVGVTNDTSYIKFYNRCLRNEFKGYTLNGLRNEFIASVNKKDYSVSNLDEIINYLLKLI